MQILEIVLYGRKGGKRVLRLQPGKVNIITGQSHTGKSALIHIVSYCLGGSRCDVPAGRILEDVSWFGLLLQVESEKIFVARQNPFPERFFTTTGFMMRSVSESPAGAPAVPNMDLQAFEDNLTRLLGISANLHMPQEGSTRSPLEANIRHALFYCFQHQTEIATNQTLFHRQQSQPGNFLLQAVKDTLPYFLGAIQENELALEEQLALARRRLRQMEAEVRQNEQIRGVGVTKAKALLQEALTVGLIEERPLPDTMSELRTIMDDVIQWTPEQRHIAGSDRLFQLQDELNTLIEERGRLAETLRAAKALSGETEGFSNEAKIQGQRLESIYLFRIEENNNTCPICEQALENPTTDVEAIHAALSELSHSLSSAERERPRLREYIEQLNQQMVDISARLNDKAQAIGALLGEQETAQRLRDLNSRRAKVVGRISLYLESVPREAGDEDFLAELRAARHRVELLASQLDPDEKEQRLASILNRLGEQMSRWARFLQLEFSNYPVRLDLSLATVVVDMPSRPEPLNRLGSGENWISYHLIAHLALHRHFRQNQRPVPGFLFLDQPTQVYFPAELDPELQGNVDGLVDDDRQKVARMFELVFDAVAEIAPDFQVIITDHADLVSSGAFQQAIVERWRGGDALVPEEW